MQNTVLSGGKCAPLCALLGRLGFLEDLPQARAAFLSVPPGLRKPTPQPANGARPNTLKEKHWSSVGFGLLKAGRCGKAALEPSWSCLFPFPFSAHPSTPHPPPPHPHTHPAAYLRPSTLAGPYQTPESSDLDSLSATASGCLCLHPRSPGGSNAQPRTRGPLESVSVSGGGDVDKGEFKETGAFRKVLIKGTPPQPPLTFWRLVYCSCKVPFRKQSP